MDDLLQQGITAYKAGKRGEARNYFIAAIKQNQNNERAWQFMYNVANNDKERMSCLIQVLRINPQNEKAQSLLNQLKNSELHLQTPTNTPPIMNVQPQTSSLKKCPYCAETIKSEALVCRYCGRELKTGSVLPAAQPAPTKKSNAMFVWPAALLLIIVWPVIALINQTTLGTIAAVIGLSLIIYAMVTGRLKFLG